MLKLFPNGIDITERNNTILLDQVRDIECWLLKCLIGKIDHCKGELLNRNMGLLNADSEIDMIPKDREKVIDIILSKNYYKNREERENS